MSWGRSAAGPGARVIDAAEGWPATVLDTDRLRGASPGTIAGHQQQLLKVIETVKTFADTLPAGYLMTVSANGSHDGESGLFNINMGAYRPVPVGVRE